MVYEITFQVVQSRMLVFVFFLGGGGGGGGMYTPHVKGVWGMLPQEIVEIYTL